MSGSTTGEEREPEDASTFEGSLLQGPQGGDWPEPFCQTEGGCLYQMDCLELLPLLPDRSVDCVFAAPPFNLGKEYGQPVNDSRSEEDYLAWSRRWLDEIVRLLKPGGACFLYNLPRWNIHLASYLARFLTFKHWIAIDIKFSLPIAGRLYPSHYALLYLIKGPRAQTFAPTRLPLPTCRHCGGELKDYSGYKDRMNPQGVNLTDVWNDIPPVRHQRYKNRPANELALKMLDRVLDIATSEGDLVLDPFGGSGTTFVACELKKRRWIGCEIGDCLPILHRLENLDNEDLQLQQLHSQLNCLFTPKALQLRQNFGHDNSRYRLHAPNNPEQPSTAETQKKSGVSLSLSLQKKFLNRSGTRSKKSVLSCRPAATV